MNPWIWNLLLLFVIPIVVMLGCLVVAFIAVAKQHRQTTFAFLMAFIFPLVVHYALRPFIMPVSSYTARVESVTGRGGQYGRISEVQVGDTRLRVQVEPERVEVGEQALIKSFGDSMRARACFRDRCYPLAEENP